jgi:hypothetical protein
MIPKNHGGEDSLENFAIACTRCYVLEARASTAGAEMIRSRSG